MRQRIVSGTSCAIIPNATVRATSNSQASQLLINPFPASIRRSPADASSSCPVVASRPRLSRPLRIELGPPSFIPAPEATIPNPVRFDKERIAMGGINRHEFDRTAVSEENVCALVRALGALLRKGFQRSVFE